MKKMRHRILIITALTAICIAGVLLFDLTSENTRITTEQAFEKNTPFYPSHWMDYQRSYPYEYIKPESYISAMRKASQQRGASRDLRLDWEFKGPTNIGGRITDLAIHPSDLNTIYVGAASGGVLKTTDLGTTWENTFNEATTISIGAVAIDPNNPEVLYAGTGEANASSYSFLGDGVYKTTNGGDTWENIGLTASAYVGRIIVDYSNSENVYVAACGNLFSVGGERGIYKSQNGGMDWEQVLFVNDSTSGVDLVQHPENPEILFAAMWERKRGLNSRNSFGDGSGIWKSIDGGNTWEEMTNGVPTGTNVGRIGLAIAKSNPDVLYAVYDMPNTEVNVYKTNNGGDTWNQTNDNALDGMNSSFGWYFGQIRVDPVNENRVYVFGVDMYRSDNGGNSWNHIAGYFNFNEIHVDHHAMFIDENTGRIFEGNDGGLYISDNYGEDWQKLNKLGITQFYDIEIDYLMPHRLYGGTQDNNTVRTLTGAIGSWQAILGGDGFYSLVDYTNNDNIYAESQNGGLHKSTDGGWDFDYIAGQMDNDRINWSAPLIMHPEDPEILYFGTHRVWKTTNGGWNWTPVSGDLTQGSSGSFHTLTTLAISSLNPAIVLAGSADGRVHISTTNGLVWNDISEGLPVRWITRVETDPFDENTIYATVSGFRWEEAQPHVFKSTDLGENWTNISGNLPDLPVNNIKLDPENEGYMFVGTDAGVYYSEDGGEYWENIMSNLPNVPVTAMKIHNPTRKLVIGTYGISAYSIDLDYLVGANEHPLAATADLTCYPNPASARNVDITISINGLFKENSRIEITDVTGKRVNVLKPTANSNNLRWNLTNQSGTKVAPGLYIISVETDQLRYSSKIQITN
jgi:photosystem II stability/assembly factor-like uncharacterized protein